jgi:hypothetical protein
MVITKHVGRDITDECGGKWSNHVDRMQYGRPPNVASQYQSNADRQRCRETL